MASKAYSRGATEVPESVTFAGLAPQSVEADDEVLFIIEPANKPGDPVILKVRARRHEVPFRPEVTVSR